jgi:hypothetical protein
MIYKLVNKTDGGVETEEMKFMKFFHAMARVAKSTDPEFKILIDKTIEIGMMEVNSTIDKTESEKPQ